MNLNEKNLKKIKFEILKKFNSYCWIAGGAVADFFLDKKPVDIDVYFPSEKDKEAAVNKLIKMGGKKIRTYPLGIKVKYRGTTYDLCYLKPTPQETIDHFDYTVCAAAIDKDEKFYSHEDFFEHVEEKRLYYMGDKTENQRVHFLPRVRRLKKYLKKGYSIDEENLEKWLTKLVDDSRPYNRRNRKR
jgi:hypothetical protein